MIAKHTNLTIIDNSGAKKVQCIDVKGSSRQRYARLGTTVLVTAKKIKPRKKIIKKKLYPALIVGTRKEKRRRKGYYVKFSENNVLMLSEQNKFLGTRLYGPICREICGGKKEVQYKQIISYSKRTV